jgi:hypothetical protein
MAITVLNRVARVMKRNLFFMPAVREDGILWQGRAVIEMVFQRHCVNIDEPNDAECASIEILAGASSFLQARDNAWGS